MIKPQIWICGLFLLLLTRRIISGKGAFTLLAIDKKHSIKIDRI